MAAGKMRWSTLCASALLSQGCDQVPQRLRFFRLQQVMLPAEEREVGEERVEMRVQAQR